MKMIKREIKSLIHPRTVNIVSFEGKKVNDDVVKSLAAYFAIYTMTFFGIFILLSFDGFDILTNFSAAASCFNNIGPGLGAVGPAGHYGDFSYFSKIVLIFDMLVGRLEVFPMLLLFMPATWRK